MKRLYEHLLYENITILDPKYVIELEADTQLLQYCFTYPLVKEVMDAVFYHSRRLSGSDILGDMLHKVSIRVFDTNHNCIFKDHANNIFSFKEFLSVL